MQHPAGQGDNDEPSRCWNSRTIAQIVVLAAGISAAAAGCRSGDAVRAVGAESGDSTPDTGMTDDSGVDPDDSGADPQTMLPPECDDTDPFRSERCGHALFELCRSHPSESECVAQPPFVFGEEYTYLCGWAKVVTFADSSTCLVESVRGRCEAGVIPGAVVCNDPCDFDNGPDLYQSLTAIPSEDELVEMPCPEGAVLSGPIGEWTALSNQQGDVLHTYPCAAGIDMLPRLCDCAPVACEAS